MTVDVVVLEKSSGDVLVELVVYEQKCSEMDMPHRTIVAPLDDAKAMVLADDLPQVDKEVEQKETTGDVGEQG